MAASDVYLGETIILNFHSEYLEFYDLDRDLDLESFPFALLDLE